MMLRVTLMALSPYGSVGQVLGSSQQLNGGRASGKYKGKQSRTCTFSFA